ncbi:MAG: hypothetical protein FWG56_12095 [Desulfovibrionaceae bacterium]|nr:hypothetical protein [Desulfovibrionaceae bacterium]
MKPPRSTASPVALPPEGAAPPWGGPAAGRKTPHPASLPQARATAANDDVDLPVHIWKATHISEDGASHVQFVLARSNAEADEYMAKLYGLPVFSAALRAHGRAA